MDKTEFREAYEDTHDLLNDALKFLISFMKPKTSSDVAWSPIFVPRSSWFIRMRMRCVLARSGWLVRRNKVDIEMISLFQLTKLDGLKASLNQRGQIEFSFVHRGERKPLMSVPVLLFERLEPIEIRGSMASLLRYFDINGEKLRVDTSGWTKDHSHHKTRRLYVNTQNLGASVSAAQSEMDHANLDEVRHNSNQVRIT